MPYVICSASFTRPNTEVPFYSVPEHLTSFFQGLVQSGVLETTNNVYSEDGLHHVRQNIFFMETISDQMVVGSNMRIEPGWYENHVAVEEHCATHGITRGPVLFDAYNSDGCLISRTAHAIKDLY